MASDDISKLYQKIDQLENKVDELVKLGDRITKIEKFNKELEKDVQGFGVAIQKIFKLFINFFNKLDLTGIK